MAPPSTAGAATRHIDLLTGFENLGFHHRTGSQLARFLGGHVELARDGAGFDAGFGEVTGLRLGDACSLTWQNVDLPEPAGPTIEITEVSVSEPVKVEKEEEKTEYKPSDEIKVIKV